MTENKENSPLKIWGILGILALIWGSSFILMHKGLDAFNPYQIGSLRMVIATLCMLPFGLRYAKTVPKHLWKYFPLVGIIGNGIPAMLFPLAEMHINSATAGILNGLTPVFALLIGIVFFGISFTWSKLGGILLGLTGGTLVILGGSEGLKGSIFYALVVVFAAMLYGISVNLMKKYLNEVHPIAIATFTIASISIPCLIYLIYSDLPQVFATKEAALPSLGFIAILAAFGTAASTVLFYHLVQITDPIRSSSVTYLMPIVACLWGFLRTDSENITMMQIAGMLVILAGVYLLNKKKVESETDTNAVKIEKSS